VTLYLFVCVYKCYSTDRQLICKQITLADLVTVMDVTSKG